MALSANLSELEKAELLQAVGAFEEAQLSLAKPKTGLSSGAVLRKLTPLPSQPQQQMADLAAENRRLKEKLGLVQGQAGIMAVWVREVRGSVKREHQALKKVCSVEVQLKQYFRRLKIRFSKIEANESGRTGEARVGGGSAGRLSASGGGGSAAIIVLVITMVSFPFSSVPFPFVQFFSVQFFSLTVHFSSLPFSSLPFCSVLSVYFFSVQLSSNFPSVQWPCLPVFRSVPFSYVYSSFVQFISLPFSSFLFSSLLF